LKGILKHGAESHIKLFVCVSLSLYLLLYSRDNIRPVAEYKCLTKFLCSRNLADWSLGVWKRMHPSKDNWVQNAMNVFATSHSINNQA